MRAPTIVLGVVFVAGISGLATAQIVPDLAKGVIDGNIGLGFWPGRGGVPRDPSGFSVHLAAAADPSQEIIKPAGTWFVVPPGVYRWWVESEREICLRPNYLAFDFRPGVRGLASLADVVPGGKVRLDEEVPLPERPSLRFLHLENGFARWLGTEHLRDTVLLPRGKAIAMLVDTETGDYVGLSRPTEVSPASTVSFRPIPPGAPLSHLVARVHSQGPPFAEAKSLTVAFQAESGPARTPDVLVFDSAHLYAVWYDLPERRGVVHLDADLFNPEEAAVTLRAGRIEVVDLQACERPDLTVRLDLPEGFPSSNLRLQVEHLGQVVEEHDLQPGEDAWVFKRVPPGWIRVALLAGRWKVGEEIEMPPDRDEEVTLAPKPIVVVGRVTQCGRSFLGEVQFQASPEEFVGFRTDDRGTYRAVIFRPCSVYRVAGLDGGAEFVEIVPSPIVADRTLDIELPCSSYSVHIADAASREPIEAATVIVMNTTSGPDHRTTGQQFATDASGTLVLPPLKPGTMTIIAKKAGYIDAKLSESVEKGPSQRDLEILMEKGEVGSRLRVYLPSGAPASGARAAGIDAAGQAVVWTGECGQDGLLELPANSFAASLAIRHEDGVWLGAWPGSLSHDLDGVVLANLGPPRRLLAATRRGVPSSGARVAIWVRGVRLTSMALAWLTQRHPLCDQDGQWSASGLPAESVHVLVWESGQDADRRAELGTLDAQRIEWRHSVPTLRVVAAE